MVLVFPFPFLAEILAVLLTELTERKVGLLWMGRPPPLSLHPKNAICPIVLISVTYPNFILISSV